MKALNVILAAPKEKHVDHNNTLLKSISKVAMDYKSCDYLSMMNKAGCNNSFTEDDIQDLHRRVRKYTSTVKIVHRPVDHSQMKPKDIIFDLPDEGYKILGAFK